MEHPALRNSNVNILGEPLEICSLKPLTGWRRDGCCSSGADDHGTHAVCAVVTADFLAVTRAQGNDLTTPRPEYGFPGLKPGDRWCLCASRWEEARQAGVAPPIIAEATGRKALAHVSAETLLSYQHSFSTDEPSSSE